MSQEPETARRKGPVALRDLIGEVIDPVTRKRGFATADLLAVWPDIAGPALAGWTAPEKIVWPRGRAANEASAGTLVLRVDGPRAIFVQHEVPLILERINRFFGYRAIGQVRIVQGRVAGPREAAKPDAALPPAAEAALGATLAGVGDERLREALERLGRGVLAGRRE